MTCLCSKKICSLELETENMEKLNSREYKNLSSQLDDSEHGHLDVRTKVQQYISANVLKHDLVLLVI